jgi:type I restriction enzyme M protein
MYLCSGQTHLKNQMRLPCVFIRLCVYIKNFHVPLTKKYNNMTLSEILKDSDYRHAQFNLIQIHEFEQRIIVKNDSKGKEIPYIKCLARGKEIRLTPEEAIRQLYLEILLNDYKYPADRIELEYNVTFGREKKRTDIVIFDKQQAISPHIIAQRKKSNNTNIC